MRERSLDWAHSALGVCVTLAMALSFDEEETAWLWSLVKRHVGTFVHVGAEQMPAPVTDPQGIDGSL